MKALFLFLLLFPLIISAQITDQRNKLVSQKFSLKISVQTKENEKRDISGKYVKGTLHLKNSKLTGYIKIKESFGTSTYKSKYDTLRKTMYYESDSMTIWDLFKNKYRLFHITGFEQKVLFKPTLDAPSQQLQAYRCKSFIDENQNYFGIVKIPISDSKKMSVFSYRIVHGVIDMYTVNFNNKQLFIVKRDYFEQILTTSKTELKEVLTHLFYDDPELKKEIDKYKKRFTKEYITSMILKYNQKHKKELNTIN
ncbi:hypothetical protein KMW28_27525 [Flammeovirga yaeyamensis]|uniref:GLPGLI family protein n=1 Tax=Flammeovirga yaeyamensis TaxID=367791 RepID=A0AAX1NEI9_9BACT|nr:hypothetical protein [Flammeovirga yaeyamensis]MBB3699965.1 hypothetical protein [Flammeovirga yaeyamensis]NMF37596.1 hypothetical protein [Flammeovirga yaeyamensis]QWG04653.1 hypothetical protein KMW28_27525 [Flammeovirga yaeyamensis]